MASNADLSAASVYAPPQRRRGSRIPTLVWVVLLAAGVALGVVAGRMTAGGGKVSCGELGGKVALTEKELDRVAGTYVLDGETYEVSAREALLQQGSLEAAKNSDETYAMPSAESVIAAARTAVLMREVERRGIAVTDDEAIAYAKETFGTEDLASLASAYSMDEETLRARLAESAAIAKLRAEVVDVTEEPPQEPTAPENGDRMTASKDYAAYIIALAGDEWDSEAGNWASSDGPFATALHDHDVRADFATYDAASIAYDVAYQQYSSHVTSANTQWTSFVNTLLSDASIAVSTLGS